eukprot:scaffold978_cov118-Isochrysis_galbana.AAC.3
MRWLCSVQTKLHINARNAVHVSFASRYRSETAVDAPRNCPFLDNAAATSLGQAWGRARWLLMRPAHTDRVYEVGRRATGQLGRCRVLVREGCQDIRALGRAWTPGAGFDGGRIAQPVLRSHWFGSIRGRAWGE